MARPSLDDELEGKIDLIIHMIKNGAADKEIIDELGISRSTWKNKKKNNPIIRKAIEELLDERNEEVENKLYKNAVGYHYYEEVATKVKSETIVEGQILVDEDVKVVSVKKYSKPDLLAQKYWLNNKKKLVWKDDPHKVENDKKIIKLKEKEVESKIL